MTTIKDFVNHVTPKKLMTKKIRSCVKAFSQKQDVGNMTQSSVRAEVTVSDMR